MKNAHKTVGFLGARGRAGARLGNKQMHSATIKSSAMVERPDRFFVIAAPIMAGKSFFCTWQNALDVDCLVYGDDPEFDDMFNQRSEALERDMDWTRHNRIMARRLATALNTVVSDEKQIVLLHSIEMARAVGLDTDLIVLPTDQSVLEEGPRWQGYVDTESTEWWSGMLTSSIQSLEGEVFHYHKEASAFSFAERREWQEEAMRLATEAGVVLPMPRWLESPSYEMIGHVPHWMLAGQIPAGNESFMDIIKAVEAAYLRGDLPPQTAAIWMSSVWRCALPVELAQYVDYAEWCAILNTINYYVNSSDIDRPHRGRTWLSLSQLSEEDFSEVTMCMGEHAKMPIRLRDLLRSPEWRKLLSHPDVEGPLNDAIQAATVIEEQHYVGVIMYLVSISGTDLAKLVYNTRVLSVPYDYFVKVGKSLHNQVRINGTFFGVALTDKEYSQSLYLYTLFGRMKGDVDVEAEILKRTKPLLPKTMYDAAGMWSTDCYDRELGKQVAHYFGVYSEGLSRRYEKLNGGPGLEKFLKHANRWMANGALGFKHKVAVEAIFKIGLDVHVQMRKKGSFEMRGTIERVLEILDLAQQKKARGEFVDYGSETTILTKNEIAALRALYPANVINYIVFSYVLQFVEKAACIEDSTLGGGPDTYIKVASRLREAAFGIDDCVCYFMGDFADFNNLHERQHMKQVMEELRRVFKSSGAYGEEIEFCFGFLIDSFDGIVLHDKTGGTVRFEHGLLSGWRGTTFINSVLNNAYIGLLEQLAIDLNLNPGFKFRDSGGDDIANSMRCWADCFTMIVLADVLHYDFNFIKQLFSYRFGEFFRLVVTTQGTYGSLARAISAYVSGNWLSMASSDPVKKISELYQNLDKLRRRQCPDSVVNMLRRDVVDRWGKVRTKAGFTKINQALVHATVGTGGLGIPDMNGDIWEVANVRRLDSETELEAVANNDQCVISRVTVDEDIEKLAAIGVSVPPDVDRDRVARQMAVDNYITSVANVAGKEIDVLMESRINYFSQQPTVLRKLSTVAAAAVPIEDLLDFVRNEPESHVNAARFASMMESVKKTATLLGVSDQLHNLEGDWEHEIRWYNSDYRLYGKYAGRVSDNYVHNVIVYARWLCYTERSPGELTDHEYINSKVTAICDGIMEVFPDEFLN